MEDKVKKVLMQASRQYCHNNGEGLLCGYDSNVTEKIVGVLLGRIKTLEAEKGGKLCDKSKCMYHDYYLTMGVLEEITIALNGVNQCLW